MIVGGPLEALQELIDESDTIVAVGQNNLLSDLKEATPVDTGAMKASWSMSKNVDGYDIINSQDYADVIDGGRRVVNGRAYGSESLVDGFDPIIVRADDDMDIAFRRIVK